jgi:hypothetical protein
MRAAHRVDVVVVTCVPLVVVVVVVVCVSELLTAVVVVTLVTAVTGVDVTTGAAVVTGANAEVVVVAAAPFADPELPEPPLSLTSAAVSPANDRRMTTTMATTKVRQCGGAANLVRAAAPHSRHQSWSSRSGVPQSGQRSTPDRPGSEGSGAGEVSGLTLGPGAPVGHA